MLPCRDGVGCVHISDFSDFKSTFNLHKLISTCTDIIHIFLRIHLPKLLLTSMMSLGSYLDIIFKVRRNLIGLIMSLLVQAVLHPEDCYNLKPQDDQILGICSNSLRICSISDQLTTLTNATSTYFIADIGV